MAEVVNRSPEEWFHKAEQDYVEGHQACAFCGESHRVFKKERRDRQEFYCIDCDFYVWHDKLWNRYRVKPGTTTRQEDSSKPITI